MIATLLWIPLLGMLALAVAGMAGPVQKQFFPSSDRPEVLVSIFLPQGGAIVNTDATARRVEAILEKLPEVKTLSAFVGAGAPRFFISANPELPDPAFAKIIVVAHDVQARDRIISELQRHIEAGEFPEARVRVSRLLYGPPVIWPLSFRILGPDPIELRRIAHAVRAIMADNPHAVEPHLEWDERAPVLHLAMDLERLRLLGLTPLDVSQQLQFQLHTLCPLYLRSQFLHKQKWKHQLPQLQLHNQHQLSQQLQQRQQLITFLEPFNLRSASPNQPA